MRSYDGRYTDLVVCWKEITLRVQSATVEGDLLLLITPLAGQAYKPATLVVEAGVLWNREGHAERIGDALHWATPGAANPCHLFVGLSGNMVETDPQNAVSATSYIVHWPGEGAPLKITVIQYQNFVTAGYTGTTFASHGEFKGSIGASAQYKVAGRRYGVNNPETVFATQGF